MFKPNDFRAKAAEYGAQLETSTDTDHSRELRDKQQRYTTLADNEQWLSDNYDKTVQGPGAAKSGDLATSEQEDRLLRYLGAAVIMHWDTLPGEVRRELFDNASAMGELDDTATLRGQIARFLDSASH